MIYCCSCKTNTHGPGLPDRCLCDKIEQKAREIIAQESQPAGWISVDTRLPEEDVGVLCCTSDDEVAIFSHHNSFFTDEFHELVDVTHWMPLPAPPADLLTGEE